MTGALRFVDDRVLVAAIALKKGVGRVCRVGVLGVRLMVTGPGVVVVGVAAMSSFGALLCHCRVVCRGGDDAGPVGPVVVPSVGYRLGYRCLQVGCPVGQMGLAVIPPVGYKSGFPMGWGVPVCCVVRWVGGCDHVVL